MALSTATPTKHASTQPLNGLVDSIEQAAADYLKSPDPENIHQIRVSTRRARAALKLSPDGSEATEALLDEMNWLRRTVGSTREADVVIETVTDRIGHGDEETVERLAPLTLALRNTANLLRGGATRSLRSARFKRLIATLRKYDRQLAFNSNGARATESDQETASAKEVIKRHRRLKKAANDPNITTDPESLHLMRKEAKKFRYALEAANAQSGSGFVTKRIDKLKKLQEDLGQAHDFQVAAERVGELSERNIEKWSEETLGSADLLRKDLLKQADKHASKAPRKYAKFNGKKPRARLSKTLRKLEL